MHRRGFAAVQRTHSGNAAVLGPVHTNDLCSASSGTPSSASPPTPRDWAVSETHHGTSSSYLCRTANQQQHHQLQLPCSLSANSSVTVPTAPSGPGLSSKRQLSLPQTLGCNAQAMQQQHQHQQKQQQHIASHMPAYGLVRSMRHEQVVVSDASLTAAHHQGAYAYV